MLLFLPLKKQAQATVQLQVNWEKKISAGKTVNKITFISPTFLLLQEFRDWNEHEKQITNGE